MRLLSHVQMSPAISKDGVGIHTLLHYPGAPGLPYGRVGKRKCGFDEPCFSGSVAFLYSEGIRLESLDFPCQREYCAILRALSVSRSTIFADQFYV